MKPAWLTAALVAAFIGVVVAVPPVRDGLRIPPYYLYDQRAGQHLPDALLERAVQPHAQDPIVWLGYAESLRWNRFGKTPSPGGPKRMSAAEAFEKATALAPKSAAIRFRYALCCLGKAGYLNREEDRLPEEPAPPPRTAAELANLRKGRELLLQCRALAPGNSACDYLLAWTYLAEHQDDKALAALRAARAKSDWTLYEREQAEAVLRLWDDSGVPVGFGGIKAERICEYDFFVSPATRELARVVTVVAEGFRQKGDHNQAIMCWEALARLGHLMRVNARSSIDGLVGLAISGIAGGPLRTQQDMGRLRAARGEERGGLENQVMASRFSAYMREHGRDDLAAFYTRDIAEGAQFEVACHVAFEGPMRAQVDTGMRAMYGSGTLQVLVLWALAGLMLGLGATLGVVSLLRRSRGAPENGVRWRYSEWLLLLVCSILPAVLAAQVAAYAIYRAHAAFVNPSPAQDIGTTMEQIMAFFGSMASRIGLMVWAQEAAPVLCLLGACVGLLLWLGLVLFIAHRKGAALRPEAGPRRAALFVAGLRTLVAPTVAALLLLSLVFVWSAHSHLKRVEDQTRAVMLQGDTRYWGIGGTDPTAKPPAP